MTIEEYEKYCPQIDFIVNITSINLFSIMKRNNNKIIFRNFDRKNKEHQYLLNVAYINFDVFVECEGVYIADSKINTFLINLKNRIRKKHFRVHNLSSKKELINTNECHTVDEILDFMRGELKDRIPIEGFDFGSINDLYFSEGSK